MPGKSQYMIVLMFGCAAYKFNFMIWLKNDTNNKQLLNKLKNLRTCPNCATRLVVSEKSFALMMILLLFVSNFVQLVAKS